MKKEIAVAMVPCEQPPVSGHTAHVDVHGCENTSSMHVRSSVHTSTTIEQKSGP